MNFQIWKTVRVGGKSRDELLVALEAKGFKVSNRAKDMMTKPGFIITPDSIEISLVEMTVRDFGFPKGAMTCELWAQIKECGGRLCPPDLGPHLRLAYADQYIGEHLWVAMEQITDSKNCPLVFRVCNDGGERWLSGNGVGPDVRWFPEYVIVFVGSSK